MRFFIFFLIFFIPNVVFAIYIPCEPTIWASKALVKKDLRKKFRDVMRELSNLKKKYEENLEVYKKSNTLLDFQISLLKEKLIKNKEIIFELNKFNQNLGLSISAESINREK